MPIYELECPHCGNKEIKRTTSFEDEIFCELCGYVMKKIPSLSNFKLNGAGWAKDGYK